MTEATVKTPPAWFRAASVLALVWTLFGIYTYLIHVGMMGDATAGMTEAERALAESTPVWVTTAYAIAVFAGAAGALGLVLLKRWAKPLLIVSLVAVLAQEAWIVFMSDAATVHGNAAFVLPLAIVVVAAMMVWMADTGTKKGWLR